MSGDLRNSQTRPDDIELLALLERCIHFFRRNRWILLIGIVAGLLLGFLKFSSLPTIYKSRLILNSSLVSNQNYIHSLLSNQNCIQIVTNWNALLKSGEYKPLVDLFNTTNNVLQKVKQIKAEEIQKIFSANNPNGFIIDVWVTDVSILDNLQKGIVYGFDNSDYVKDRLIAKRNKLQELIKMTSYEIKWLDSTKKMVESILAGKETSSSPLIVDGSSLSLQLVDIHEKLLGYEEELRFSNAVQVLQSFSKFKNPAGPNLYKWLLLGFVAGLSVAYLIALFRSVNQKLKARARLQERT